MNHTFAATNNGKRNCLTKKSPAEKGERNKEQDQRNEVATERKNS